MSAQKEWKPCVYIVANEGERFRYWALVSYQDGVVTRYSREGTRNNLATAAIAARDMSRMYNNAGLTPKQEGTTFTTRKLPRGVFADKAQMAEIYAAQDKRTSQFLAAMDNIAKSAKNLSKKQ